MRTTLTTDDDVAAQLERLREPQGYHQRGAVGIARIVRSNTSATLSILTRKGPRSNAIPCQRTLLLTVPTALGLSGILRLPSAIGTSWLNLPCAPKASYCQSKPTLGHPPVWRAPGGRGKALGPIAGRPPGRSPPAAAGRHLGGRHPQPRLGAGGIYPLRPIVV